MGLYCLISPGGAPGVTTTALALTLTWNRPVLMVEADPGGRRVLPGFLADKLNGSAPGPGLLGLAMDVQHDPAQAATSLDRYALALPGVPHAAVVHGIRDPRHGRQLSQAWGILANALADSDTDVIADIGRIGGAECPIPLLARADVIVMVLRPTLVGLDAARPRIDALRELLPQVSARNGRLGVCVIDDGAYTSAEVGRFLDVPVWARLPLAPADARVLSDGGRPRMTFRTSVLMRSAGKFGQRLRRQIDERAFTNEPMARPPGFGGGSR
jgi:hypothetical protein